jgi:hypothetical protein
MRVGDVRPYRVLDLTGRRFGLLVVVSLFGADQHKRKTWLCLCDCGQGKVIPSRHLVNGAVISCGCYMRSRAPQNGKKGGHKLKGERSHLYKSSLSEADRLVGRNIPEVREWRRLVYERDDYACQVCGERGRKIQAHHLHPWAVRPELRFDLSNGVTVCRVHHKQFHDSMGGPRAVCTPDDFWGFKARWYLDREISRTEGTEKS